MVDAHEDGAGSSTVLVHITDAHITPSGRRGAVLKDLSVEICRDLVAQAKEIGADAVLFGGDTIDNRGHGRADLDAFLEIVDDLETWYCVYGNHEADAGHDGRISKAEFAQAVAGHGIEPGADNFSAKIGDLRLLGVNTSVVGDSSGHICDETVAFVDAALEDSDDSDVLVLGHHLLDRPWAPYTLDQWDRDYLAANRGLLITKLAQDPRVLAYMCGHHHASRITTVTEPCGGSFHHILTPSPAAHPCFARVVTVNQGALSFRPLYPRIEQVGTLGADAVVTGRKAKRFVLLGADYSFFDYLSGSDSDVRGALPRRRSAA